MPNLDTREARNWFGRTAIDVQGDKIGKVDTVYLDDATGRPEWLAIETGWFGNNVSFVPIEAAEKVGDDIRVSFDKSIVKDAPNIPADGHINPEEEQTLFAYYGREYEHRGTDSDPSARHLSGPTTDDAMTRSEEELRIDTRRHDAGVARLRKWIETEDVEVTVPVQKEKARLVTEPITAENRDRTMSGPELSADEHEIVLSEEEIVVDKRVVPKEQVRLETDVETEQVAVEETVRKEQIDLDRSSDRRR